MENFPFERVEPDQLCLYEMKPGEQLRFIEPLMTAREFAMFANHLMGGYMLAQDMTHENFKTVLGYLHRFRDMQSPEELASLEAIFERYARLAWPDRPEEWQRISPHIQSFLLHALIFNGGIDKTLFSVQSSVLNMLGACVQRISEDKEWLLSLADGDEARARGMAESMSFTVETCRYLGKQLAEAAEQDRWLMIRPRVHTTISAEGYVSSPVPHRAEDLIRPIQPDDEVYPEGPWDLWFFSENPKGEPEPSGLIMKVAHFAIFAQMFTTAYLNLIDNENPKIRLIAETIRNIGDSPNLKSDVLLRAFRRYIAAGCIASNESVPSDESLDSIPKEVQRFLAALLITSAPLSENEMILLRHVGDFFGKFWRMGLTHPENWEVAPEEQASLTNALEICSEIADRIVQFMNLALASKSVHFIRVRWS